MKKSAISAVVFCCSFLAGGCNSGTSSDKDAFSYEKISGRLMELSRNSDKQEQRKFPAKTGMNDHLYASSGSFPSQDGNAVFALQSEPSPGSPPVQPAEPTGEPSPLTPTEAETARILESEGGVKKRAWEAIKMEYKRAGPVLFEDTVSVFENPWNWAILGAAAAASPIIRNNWDDGIDAHYRKGHHEWPKFFRDLYGAVGNPGTHFGIAGVLWLHGVVQQDQHTYELSRALFSGLIINGVATMGLKWAFCDEAPNDEEYAWPSGHTSSTMTVAAILDEYYGPWVGIPSYTVTAFVAWTRMEDREHWFSDVVFGAAMGYVIGKTVAGNHKTEVMGMQVVPLANPESESMGIGLAKTF
jgi:membrane-associated phospholipid phosphatase